MKIPNELLTVHEKHNKNNMPTSIKTKAATFPLETQYFLDIFDEKNHDIHSGKIYFAVNTDGFELGVNVKNENLDIVQNEYGEIDSLGISIRDILLIEPSS